MTSERSLELAKALTIDEEFCKKMLQSKPEEVEQILKTKGFSFTCNEIVEFGKAVAEEFKNRENKSELGETDLDKVSGGKNSGVWDGVGVFLASQAIGWGYYALVAICW